MTAPTVPRSMRAVELPGVDRPLRPTLRPIPEPGPGEVRVRVEACGVCGSDHFLQAGGFGAKVPFPIIPGHEAAGRVDAVGEGVDRLAVGDQAALYYITDPAGDPGRPRSTQHQPVRDADGRGRRRGVRRVRPAPGGSPHAAAGTRAARGARGAHRRGRDAAPRPQARRPSGAWRDPRGAGRGRPRIECRAAGQGIRGAGHRGDPVDGEAGAGAAAGRGRGGRGRGGRRGRGRAGAHGRSWRGRRRAVRPRTRGRTSRPSPWAGPAGGSCSSARALEPFSVRAAEIFWRELSVLGLAWLRPGRHPRRHRPLPRRRPRGVSTWWTGSGRSRRRTRRSTTSSRAGSCGACWCRSDRPGHQRCGGAAVEARSTSWGS